jgi:hypothetical protein
MSQSFGTDEPLMYARYAIDDPAIWGAQTNRVPLTLMTRLDQQEASLDRREYRVAGYSPQPT